MKYLILLAFSIAAMAGSYLGDDNGGAGSVDASLVVLDSFTPSLTVYLVGLGYNEYGDEFWVSNNQSVGGLGLNQIAVFAGASPYSYVETFDQNNTSSWGILDMAYASGVMYVSDYANNVFNYYNTTTQAKLGSFNTITTGAYAVATDGAGAFYTGDFNTGAHVYSAIWDGVSGSSPLWSIFTTSALPETGIIGAAYDASWPCLWVTASSGNGSIFQVGMDGALIETFDQIAQGENPAGADMAPFGSSGEKLWVLMQATPDVVYCYDCSVALDHATWGTIKSMF